MIKEAIDRILDLAVPNISVINDESWSDKELTRIEKERRAATIEMGTLTGLVDYIRSTKDFKEIPYIIQVVSPTDVRLISSLDADRRRETLVDVKAEIPGFAFGNFIENEKFIINVQSKFMDSIPLTEDSVEDAIKNDKPIILQFAGNVKAGTVAEYGDTGVGQKAAIKRGVASIQEVEVPSPCFLIPYRTFTEVDQPMSSFIFRVRDDKSYGAEFALFEADGGAWKNEAMRNIHDYLVEELKEFKNITVIS